MGGGDFDDVGVGEVLARGERGADGADAGVWGLQQGVDGGVDDGRWHLGLVPLGVDDDVAGGQANDGGGLGEAGGAVGVVGACEDAAGVEGGECVDDLLGVGSDDDAGGALGTPGLFDNVLDHRLASSAKQDLLGQARRGEACGDDDRRAWGHGRG